MKKKLIEAILLQLRGELETISRAARVAHQEATHEENKAEDQYDTRGLEASYLAAAQGKRAAELERLIALYQASLGLDLPVPRDADVGALIEVECRGKRSFFFLVGEGGGLQVSVEGKSIHVITPNAPLGEALTGKRPGDSFEVEINKQEREYRVISIS